MKTSSADLVIVELLSTDHHHLTSQQIFEKVKDRLPAINPSTVYRSLERLVKNGKVSVSDMGLGAEVYEIVGQEIHHHIVCQNCGKILTLDDQEVRSFLSKIELASNFTITTNHLVLFGICQDCQES